MSKRLSLAAGILSLAVTSVSFGAIYTVDKTGILDPNPSALTITETGNTSLAASRVLIAAANTAGTGGVLDFQQRNQGGTFPNSTAPDNGFDIANGALNPLYVTNGATGDGLVGTPFFSFYRLEATATTVTAPNPVAGSEGNNNFDSNLNNGVNTVSGGFSTRYPGAVSASNPTGDGTAVSGVNAAYAPNITVAISGAYLGVTNQGSPATIVLNNPLSFFGITAVPRADGNARTPTLTATLSDNSVVTIGTGTTSTALGALYFGYTAPVGLTISRITITEAGSGFVRFDDLAFITAAVPEPASLALLGLGGVAALRRRRA